MSDPGKSHETKHGQEIERIETISSTTTPWMVRLAFGFGGLLLLAGAVIAWQYGDKVGGSAGQALPWLIATAVLLGAGAIIETITVQIWLSLIIGIFAVAITFLVVGRVSTYPSMGQSVFVVDRFSGEVELCTAISCKVLPREGIFLTVPKLPPLHKPAAK